jgi:hypothetical protein
MKSRAFFGIILILLGGIFFLDQFSFWSFSEIISTWWPTLIIVFGIYKISTDRNSIFTGIVIFLVGVLLQANKLGFLPWGFWHSFWPMLLILAGIWIITNRHHYRFHDKRNNSDMLHEFVMFSGSEQVINTNDFKGGSISVMFGAGEYDLRQSNIQSGKVLLELFVAFGGIELKLPEHWRLEISGFPFLGGIENKTRQMAREDSPTLVIKYSVMFGGIEIRN